MRQIARLGHNDRHGSGRHPIRAMTLSQGPQIGGYHDRTLAPTPLRNPRSETRHETARLSTEGVGKIGRWR